MKRNHLLAIGFSAFTLGIIAASFIACSSTPPTAFERRFFDIQTNYTPIVAVQTNIVPVTIYRTNEFNVPVPVTVYETNTVKVTNQAEAYLYTPGAGAKNVGEVGGAVGNLFGVGGLVTTGLGALFSLWGYVRSKKSLVTAGNLTQTIETMREFVRGLPNGPTMDNELVNWMQLHQAEAGVLNQVVDLITKEVSNPDARVAADQIRATIAALGTPPIPPPAK